MVKSILGLLRCVTFVTPNPSPPISWCKWQILVRQGHRLLPCKPLSFKNVGFPGTVPWTILKILESEKGPMENHHFHHFLGSNPLRDFLSGLNDSCFLALLPKAIGWITQASKDRETHRKRQSWVSSVGELGVGWFTNERHRWFASLLFFLWWTRRASFLQIRSDGNLLLVSGIVLPQCQLLQLWAAMSQGLWVRVWILADPKLLVCRLCMKSG